MKVFTLNHYQRIMATQVLNTWRGKLSDMKTLAVAADIITLTKKEREEIEYNEDGQIANWNGEKATSITTELTMEDAPFEQMFNHLEAYKEWPVSKELNNLWLILNEASRAE